MIFTLVILLCGHVAAQTPPTASAGGKGGLGDLMSSLGGLMAGLPKGSAGPSFPAKDNPTEPLNSLTAWESKGKGPYPAVCRA